MGFLPTSNWSAGPKHTRYLSAELTQVHNQSQIYKEPTCNRNKPKKEDIFSLLQRPIWAIGSDHLNRIREKEGQSQWLKMLEIWIYIWTVQSSAVVAHASHTVLRSGIWVLRYSGTLKEYFNSFA